MLSNKAALNSSNNFKTPFKKLSNYPKDFSTSNNPPYNQRQIINPNFSAIFPDKNFHRPIHLGLNFYFTPPKNNYFQPQFYAPNIKPQEIYFQNYNNNNENIPASMMFQNSLAKSGYQLNQEQAIQFRDNYMRQNNVNNFYGNYNFCPINNNNNIINNIYPTITKVTNVQIISDNDNTLINEKKQESKKENINIDNNNNNKDANKEIKQNIEGEDIKIINNKKKLFECSETNGININNNKIPKKRRTRKTNNQLEVLSNFYRENKNYSKKEIKEISERTGLKENKIYKWLWDQKNKEFKSTKFVVKK